MKHKNKKVIAICYDFDKTLGCEDSCWSYGFFDKLKIKEADFWQQQKDSPILKNMDPIISFLYYSVYTAKKRGVPFKKKDIENVGKDLKFYKGVESWFDRINTYAKNKGYVIEHYMISASIKEVLSHSTISKYFKRIYANSYVYDEEDNPIWPANVVNSTEKTQYLYRINKGVLNENDPKVNEKASVKRIPFCNMIYIGDSLTDIPCMSILVNNGGTSIGVYDDLPAKKEFMLDLLKKERINNLCKADYTENSEIEKVVKYTIDKIEQNDKLKQQIEEL